MRTILLNQNTVLNKNQTF